jgi:hypothetical protein
VANVLVRIQHLEGRDEPLERLLASLPTSVEVVTDDGEDRNPWRGYNRCLANLPTGYTHLAILQDDTIACRNLLPALELIAEHKPTSLVSLFMAKLPRRTAVESMGLIGKKRYVAVHPLDFIPVVASLWPVEKAEGLRTWVEQNQRRIEGKPFKSDDAVVTRWAKFNRERAFCTLPSLVQHPDDVPSTITDRARGGLDKGRVALHWIGDDDPLEFDWSA